MRLFPILLTFLLAAACSKGKDVRSNGFSQNPYETSKNYFTSSTSLTVEVAYESGQAPYADGNSITRSGGTVPIWQILDENLHQLYLGRTPYPVIKVPKTLAEMKELPIQDKATWTPEEILALANKYRSGKSTSKDTYFFVVFLGGNFMQNGTVYNTTVGVSLGGTTVLAIFKDVVKSTGSGPLGIVPLYVEQATLVHELGHALGLVNNGLPMKEDHQDDAHGHHCDNPDCVMYWLNEGKSDLVQFAIRMNTTGSVVMFDNKCLKDAREYGMSTPPASTTSYDDDEDDAESDEEGE